MKKFALQLTAITTFALGLIWFAGEGGAIQTNDALGAPFASGEQFAVETLQINVDELKGEQAETKRPSRKDVYRQSKKIYETIMDIRNRYMDEIDIEELVDAGIRGMLRNLDRYSVLMERQSYDNLMEHTSGKYEGLGMQIDARKNRIVIVAPLEGGPSEKLGLRAGDVVMEIEGESTFEMTTSEASKMMRGKAGTSINIKVKREGVPDLMDYKIERAVITLHSVNYSGKIPGTDIGYLRLSTFAANSRRELRAALKKLNSDGISGLVFDLRSNGGGLLDQAWATAELFVPKNSLIVYTQ
ncbi:MAG: PDZ domain-containing protein, partial [candidate division Zixibacteria bacterium]|nr:PDZ domain-containing protein [candidate division Zixibacteria bacterium]